MPDDLLENAASMFAHLRTHGYRVRAEVADYAAPFIPTITAARGSTTLHVEVAGSVDLARLKEWAAYGKSASRDTRLAVSIPIAAAVSNETLTELRRLGIGIFVVDGTRVTDGIPPVDLAMQVELPELDRQPLAVRQLLGHAYEQFSRGEWRECFENACNALEEEARKYLLRWSRTGRIKVQRKAGPQTLTAAQIKRLTLGQLAQTFRDILTPNSLDIEIEQALSHVNPDRVERTHRRSGRRTENRLRANVGRHMWLIVRILNQMNGS